MEFSEMLDNVYFNLDSSSTNKSKLILPKIELTNSTTNTYWKPKKLLKTINRDPQHFSSFLNKEIGNITWKSSSISDGLVMIGRIKKNKIQDSVQRYIKTYVICNICKSYKTDLDKNKNTRLLELICTECKSVYTV